MPGLPESGVVAVDTAGVLFACQRSLKGLGQLLVQRDGEYRDRHDDRNHHSGEQSLPELHAVGNRAVDAKGEQRQKDHDQADDPCGFPLLLQRRKNGFGFELSGITRRRTRQSRFVAVKSV